MYKLSDEELEKVTGGSPNDANLGDNVLVELPVHLVDANRNPIAQTTFVWVWGILLEKGDGYCKVRITKNTDCYLANLTHTILPAGEYISYYHQSAQSINVQDRTGSGEITF